MHLADVNTDKVNVTEMHEGRTNWRLCMKEEDDDVSDELVLRVQGILTKNNLVPKNVASCPQSKAMFLSQFVEICGERTSTFDDSMKGVAAVYECFGRYLAGVKLNKPADSEKNGQMFFSAANRVFTAQSDAPSEQDNDFQDGLDPLRKLVKFKTGELIHAPENIVRYYKRVQEDDESPAVYQHYVPGAFAVGDIVELQVSFVALAAGNNKVKITNRLQAVTLLDNKYSEARMFLDAKTAKTARANASVRMTVNPAVRRKIGYFAEDTDDERKLKKRRGNTPDNDE
ncbi:hypothetical protein C8R43DRAFT_1125690 [Mycena crocata]|nr:hypothetical protein C8R43DRAFT_1125690 [Mycena crocata]